MKFAILVSIFAVIMVFCWAFISSTWRKYATDAFGIPLYALRSYNVLDRVWPCDDGFLSLKFSVLRHFLVAVLSSVLIWYVNILWLNRIVVAFNGLYACMVFLRYRARASDFNASSQGSKELLLPVKRACGMVLFCAIADCFVLTVVYGLRP